jgi:hypothetical protein
MKICMTGQEKGDSGGRSQSTRREPLTMGKQLVNFITCSCESSAPFSKILINLITVYLVQGHLNMYCTLINNIY